MRIKSNCDVGSDTFMIKIIELKIFSKDIKKAG